MNTNEKLPEMSTLELQKQVDELNAVIAANDRDLARAAGVNSEDRIPVLRALLDRIYVLDIEPSVKREMTDTCLHLMKVQDNAKRLRMELTEADNTFLSQLEKKHANLNTRELKICLLIKLAYATTELAHFNSINTRGMENVRYRLHKKLGLERHDSIKTYLGTMSFA